jgi:hypothetical protein
MSTQAADAWLILNDADAIETKVLHILDKVFSDRYNCEGLMSNLERTSRFYNSVTNISLGSSNSMHHSVVDIIKHTLGSAEVMIQDDYVTRTPRIAIRFQAPNGPSFVIQPRVTR